MSIFKDRREAGEKLGRALLAYREQPETVVVGLARGGVAVAREAARILRLPLELYITRKIGVPGDPELAAGAVTESGEVYLDREYLERFNIHPLYLDEAVARLKEEIARFQKIYRENRPRYSLKGRTVILVDDGIATGSTVLATVRALRKEGVERIVLAVPVAPLERMDELNDLADETVVLAKPHPFFAVGAAYHRFEPLSDEEVKACLSPPTQMAGGRR